MNEQQSDAAAVIDLGTFDTLEKSNDGIVIELVAPNGQTTSVFLKVLGRDSDVFRQISFDQQNAALSRRLENGGKPVVDVAQGDADLADLLASCVAGWSNSRDPWTNTILVDGKQMPFSKANVLTMFRRIAWMRDRVDAAIGNRENFLKG